jgi:hypothetical protein
MRPDLIYVSGDTWTWLATVTNYLYILWFVDLPGNFNLSTDAYINYQGCTFYNWTLRSTFNHSGSKQVNIQHTWPRNSLGYETCVPHARCAVQPYGACVMFLTSPSEDCTVRRKTCLWLKRCDFRNRRRIIFLISLIWGQFVLLKDHVLVQKDNMVCLVTYSD